MDNPPPGVPCYPLANPKGTQYLCEICSKPSLLQCALCRTTYYCGVEHQKLDWVGIHNSLCVTLKELRRAAPFIASETERRKKKDELQKININTVHLSTVMSQKFLFQSKYEEAVPAALQCLKFTIDAFGMASAELVVPYLLLAEASIGVGRLCQAENYLAQAQWTLAKMQHESSYSIRSQVHRKLGLLYTVKGEYENALENLAKDIFFASCQFGTDHIRTAGGYFQLGQVFYAMTKKDNPKGQDHHFAQSWCDSSKEADATEIIDCANRQACRDALNAVDCRLASEVPQQFASLSAALQSQAPGEAAKSARKDSAAAAVTASVVPEPRDKARVADSLLTRVVDIWSKHLCELVSDVISSSKSITNSALNSVAIELLEKPKPSLDDAQKAEVEYALNAIDRYRTRRLLEDHAEAIGHALGVPDPKTRLQFALAMLNFVQDRRSKAIHHFSQGKISLQLAAPHVRLDFERKLLEEALAERRGGVECIKTMSP